MWFLPSYKRVDRARDALDAMIAHGSTAPGLLLVNGDDPSDYEGLSLPPGWLLVRVPGANPRVADCWRHAFELHPDLPWYGLITDDMLVRTDGFEQALIETAGDRRIATSNDLKTAKEDIFAGRFTGAAVIGGELARAVGGVVAGDMRHCFLDDLWEGIGRDFSCWTVRMDVVVEHMHAWFGKSEEDETYTRANSDIEQDRARYDAWRVGERLPIYDRIGKMHNQAVRTVSLADRKVAIATPAYNGDVKVAFARSLLDSMSALSMHGVQVNWITVNQESLIQRARNRIVCEFLKGDATHLMFIDADEGWRPDGILRLLASGKDLCAVAAPRKQTPMTFCANFMSDQIPTDPADGMIKVNEVGTGFMLISRKLLEHMISAMPELAYEEGPDTIHAVFDFALKDRRYWSEDYVFCQRARALGYDVWVDPRVAIDHIGPYTWSGMMHDWLIEQGKPKVPTDAETAVQIGRAIEVALAAE